MGRYAVIVLDTCAIIWDALRADRLTTKAKQTLKAAEADNELVISDISIWEIAMLVSKGKDWKSKRLPPLLSTYTSNIERLRCSLFLQK